jgi:prepilin-type N-terminal cleavage/methylation domain-containing protein
MKNREHGFSLVELLICVGIIMVLAAVAIPYFKGALQTTFETAAVRNIQTIHTAQAHYFAGKHRYAESLAELGQPEQLRDGKHNSYLFRIEPTETGYAILATPEKPGRGGQISYYSDESQVVRYARGKAAGLDSPAIE